MWESWDEETGLDRTGLEGNAQQIHKTAAVKADESFLYPLFALLRGEGNHLHSFKVWLTDAKREISLEAPPLAWKRSHYRHEGSQ